MCIRDRFRQPGVGGGVGRSAGPPVLAREPAQRVPPGPVPHLRREILLQQPDPRRGHGIGQLPQVVQDPQEDVRDRQQVHQDGQRRRIVRLRPVQGGTRGAQVTGPQQTGRGGPQGRGAHQPAVGEVRLLLAGRRTGGAAHQQHQDAGLAHRPVAGEEFVGELVAGQPGGRVDDQEQRVLRLRQPGAAELLGDPVAQGPRGGQLLGPGAQVDADDGGGVLGRRHCAPPSRKEERPAASSSR